MTYQLVVLYYRRVKSPDDLRQIIFSVPLRSSSNSPSIKTGKRRMRIDGLALQDVLLDALYVCSVKMAGVETAIHCKRCI